MSIYTKDLTPHHLYVGDSEGTDGCLLEIGEIEDMSDNTNELSEYQIQWRWIHNPITEKFKPGTSKEDQWNTVTFDALTEWEYRLHENVIYETDPLFDNLLTPSRHL